MKKLLLFLMLTSFLTVNAQHASHDFKPASIHYNYANDVKSDIIPIKNWNLTKTVEPKDEIRGFDSDIIPVKDWNLTKTVEPKDDLRGFDSDIIPVKDWNLSKPVKPIEEQREIRSVNPVAIGQSGNAFGFAFSRTTYLWADNNINSVAFMHRMIAFPGTGYLAYDFSKDGGLTWANNIQTYNPTLPGGVDGRYPQGAIYNPVGNKNPDEAFYHYFAPTLDGSNTDGVNNWGGYAYGVKKLAEGSVQTQHNRTSTPPFYQYLPSAFTITQAGDAWMVDENSQGGASTFNYLGSLIVGHGIWDTDLSDYIYDFNLFPLEIATGDFINDVKIAFAPDGLTGYICVMTNLPDALPYTSYHPILFKTTDGGETWSDPIEVQLGGDYGLEPIQEYIADSNLIDFFNPDPVPARNKIDYWMGYEVDLSVDAWGNPHIIGLVAIADNAAGNIYTSEGLIAMFHVWSDDLGENWNAFNLGYIKQFKAEFVNGDATITMFNRPQAATTQDGAILFFSWIDTENPLATDNSQPDIFFREYLPTLKSHGDAAENVTTFSAGMWSSYFGCMSHYVFSEVTGSNYTCIIPFVYEQLGAGNDPLQPVQFYYIPDFVKTYTITGISSQEVDPAVMVSQNNPNPFSSSTNIRVSLLRDAHLTLEVYNLTGSLVKQFDFSTMNKGIHDIQFNAGGLSKGVYFYSINAGYSKVTKKMVIQ
jgi:hypothetical protein